MMKNSSWRFLNTGYHDAFMNMAIDEVLSQKSVIKDNKPVFRIYAWRPYAISIGYNQNENDIDLEKCDKDNIDVVRRPTGGRAIFHAEEVTYSVMLPSSSPLFAKDTLTLYNIISEGLVEGLQMVGIKAELVKRATDTPLTMNTNIPCFSSAAKYEIAAQNKKLVGSAQRRYQHSVLQHGSILVGKEHLRLGEYIVKLKGKNVDIFRKFMEHKTISISEITKTVKKYEEIIWGIKHGFQQKLGIQFLEGQLTPPEIQEAKKLTDKYKKIWRKKDD
ncbi:hypothetical protein GF337_17245 [candidate division KSB1 bacterium]|nr:hypothetical protein [candidate division KSB1 bacterium]